MNLQQAYHGYLVHSQVENETATTIHDIKWNLERFKWKGRFALEAVTTNDLRQYLLFRRLADGDRIETPHLAEAIQYRAREQS